jgi:hypothetical protein
MVIPLDIGIIQLPTKAIVEVVFSGVFLTVLLGVFSNNLKDAQKEIKRREISPQDDWSGAYEHLFRSILDRAETKYAEANGESSEDLTFIITIDDIDRCENKTAYEILIALKSFLAVENCIYIIPCDRKALLEHLESVDDSAYLRDSINQQDFLAKLIDTELDLVEPIPGQLQEYIDEQIQDTVHSFDKRTLDVIRRAEFTTPRRITRVLNRLVVLTELATNRSDTALNSAESPTHSWRMRDSEATPSEDILASQDWEMPFLAVVAVLQETYPSFYDKMVDDPYRLTEVYGQLHQGFESDQKGLESYLKELSVPSKIRNNLIKFLTATVDIGMDVDDPEPYLRLGGSPLTSVETFRKRLKEGQTEALIELLERQPQCQETKDIEGVIERVAH